MSYIEMNRMHEGILRENRAYVHVILIVEKILNAIESNDTAELRELIAYVKSEYPTEWGEMKTLSNEWRDEQ